MEGKKKKKKFVDEFTKNIMLKRRKHHLNDSMLRTFGALGIFMNREVEKNDMRLLASKFAGISIAVSFTVSNKRKRLICAKTVLSVIICVTCPLCWIDYIGPLDIRVNLFGLVQVLNLNFCLVIRRAYM